MSRATLRNEMASLAAVAVIALLVCIPLLIRGVPSGHSAGLNVSWFRGFNEQLLAGDLYPRWIAYLNGGAGSPVFYFYAPLPFYVSSAAARLFCPACSASIQMGLGASALLLLSGVSFYVFARRRADPLVAALAAILYMALPYHFEINLWRRQAIGEFATYAFIPLAFYFLERVAQKERGLTGLAIVYALVAFSHLPTALILSMFLLFYALFLAYQQRSWELLVRFGAAVTLGAGLAAIYLLPALLTQHYIHAEKWWTGYFRYDSHWITSRLAIDDFKQRLVLVLVGTTLMAIPLLASLWRSSAIDRRRLALPWIGMVLLAWFLMVPVSQFVWDLIPVLQKIQFPWRVATMLDFSVAAISVLALQRMRESRGRIITPAAVAAAVLLILVYAANVWQLLHLRHGVWAKPTAAKQLSASSKNDLDLGYDAPEYLPIWVKEHDLEWETLASALHDIPLLRYPTAAGQVRILDAEARRIDLAIDTKENALIGLHQFYYPAWRAVTDTPGVEVQLRPAGPFGLMELSAPAGRYHVTVALVSLWQERAGQAISAGSAGLILVCWMFVLIRQRPLSQSPANTST